VHFLKFKFQINPKLNYLPLMVNWQLKSWVL